MKDVNREHGPKQELIFINRQIADCEMTVYRVKESIRSLKMYRKLLERELKKELEA